MNTRTGYGEKRLTSFDELGPTLANFLLGKHIGSGIARDAYVLKTDPKFVVKIETSKRDFQNIAEWTLWNEAPGMLQMWLAEVTHISDCGRLLIQRRAEPITEDRLPKKVPAVLADLHKDNWGWLDGRPVAIDFGRNYAVAMNANAHRLRKVSYW